MNRWKWNSGLLENQREATIEVKVQWLTHITIIPIVPLNPILTLNVTESSVFKKNLKDYA